MQHHDGAPGSFGRPAYYTISQTEMPGIVRATARYLVHVKVIAHCITLCAYMAYSA